MWIEEKMFIKEKQELIVNIIIVNVIDIVIIIIIIDGW